jgi:RecA-family ATPase
VNFNPLPLTEFLKEETDPVSWLIRGLWKKGGYTLVSGPPKLARKSFLVERMALCLAAYHEDGGIVPTMRTRVLYIAEEGPRIDAQDRLKAQCSNLGLAPEDIAEDFYMLHLSGFRLFNEEHMAAILRWCDEYTPGAVILDPWSKVGPDDGDSTEASLICMQSVAELQRRRISVCIVAHTKKLQSNIKLDIDQEVRGSNVLTGAYDTHVALRPLTEGISIPLTIRNKNAAQTEHTLFWTMETKYDALRQEEPIVNCKLEWKVKT